MPRYFFDINNGDGLVPDEDGAVIASIDGVREAAVTALPDIARDVIPNSNQRVISVRVRDEFGHYVFHATLTLVAEWLDRPENV